MSNGKCLLRKSHAELVSASSILKIPIPTSRDWMTCYINPCIYFITKRVCHDWSCLMLQGFLAFCIGLAPSLCPRTFALFLNISNLLGSAVMFQVLFFSLMSAVSL